jgi:histidyl-tRNA synthetase
MSELKFKAIYGTRDILPNEAKVWQKVISTVTRLASIYGYGFIHPPIFEATELFARGIGETTDIVSKEMYTFRDQGDRTLTLRPEGTASVVRAYLEHSMGAREALVKVFYFGPMFRQERPQAGRLRQFYQFGVEAIGSLDPALDAEVIGLNYRILSELGIENIKVSVNSIGMPEDRKVHRQAFVSFVEPILAQFCPDCQKRFQINPLRMFDCKEKSCQTLLAEAPTIYEYLSPENLTHLNKVTNFLSLAEVPFQIDKRLVRGLDYYTRTAWEIKSDKIGSQDSLSGGGRYDLLVEQLGGSSTPGIGFAAGIERIIMAMPENSDNIEALRPGFFIAISDNSFKDEACKLVNKIRKLGFAADIDYLGRSMKAQMKQANRSRFQYTIILANQEMSRGQMLFRNMASSAQTEIELKKIYDVQYAEQLGEIIGKE